jgi:hypothetical protein
MKNAVFCEVTLCGSFKNRRFVGYSSFSLRVSIAVTANVVPKSLTLVTLMMEAIRSSETSILTRATLRNIPENGIPHSHCRESLKSYIALTGWTL